MVDPGGHLDFGEDPADCARREAAEETGLRVGEVRFLGVTSDIFDTHRHYITLWFEATNVDGEATLSAPEEMSELGWFPRRELPDYCSRRCADCSMASVSGPASGVTRKDSQPMVTGQRRGIAAMTAPQPTTNTSKP